MEFQTPTTLEELYETLNDVFNYYRLQVENYTAADLTSLDLTRMSYTPLSDEQLTVLAGQNVAAAQKIRQMAYVDSLNEKIADVDEKISAETVKKTERLKANDLTYSSAKEVIIKHAIKTGTTDSGIYAEKLSALERERLTKEGEITALCTAETYKLNQEKQRLNGLLSNASGKYSDVCASEVSAEFNKLKSSQEQTVRTVFTYNNELDEKEQRYENTRKQLVAGMLLRHMEIRAKGYTKDELVDRGYYNDVIACVKSYYDGMTAAQAFTSIKSQPKLAIYLDDYYSNIVYYYKTLAESS